MSSASLYADVHRNHQGAGDARPTALQIIKDEVVGCKLTGKVIVITGATSSIFFETASALSAIRATLLLTARNLEKAENSRLNSLNLSGN
ncbi:short-chain dehydrogenase [Penicillium argentinense]|uniref:Short-chain dehydrogenase n=1 Tax=Penicillium argentinense TaxID=1131581 RepID=A0A9W9KFG0_9EURO|nr:short-chain dehydrogenase [Penicillium argentinense]KAJ5103172.1 short-chain dehydrogenase [Penicillium argentinense]